MSKELIKPNDLPRILHITLIIDLIIQGILSFIIPNLGPLSPSGENLTLGLCVLAIIILNFYAIPLSMVLLIHGAKANSSVFEFLLGLFSIIIIPIIIFNI